MIIETRNQGGDVCLGREIGKGGPARFIRWWATLVGKTVFTQGVAAGLCIEEPISSPTFTIIQEYVSGRLPFYHFDVYRIGDVEEMEEIGYDDYFFRKGHLPDRVGESIEELIPEEHISITIEKDLEQGFDYRRITVEARKVLGISGVEWEEHHENTCP